MNTWIYPANPKYYDVLEAFSQETTPAWPVSSKVGQGDIGSQYIDSLYSKVKYSPC